MNFTNFEYFLVVEEERSITKAAEHLHITQQTLSASISNLEKELGCKLFVRHMPLELTYAGTVFKGYAMEFRNRYQAMRNEFLDITEGREGLIKVGIGYTRGRTIMPALTEMYQKEYPNYHIEMVEGSNELLKKLLLDGEIDLAIANFNKEEKGLNLYPFYEEEIILTISRQLMENYFKDRVDWAIEELLKGNLSVLEGCPFVLGRPEDVTGRLSRQFIRDSVIRPEIKAISDNLETLLAMCVRNVGACFCPKNLMEMALSKSQQEMLYKFEIAKEARYQIRFGVREKNYQWSAISEFMRIAKESGLFHSTEN